MNITNVESRNLSFKDGIKSGLPIFLGYFPIAMAFGILSKTTGLTLYETLSFSLIVFAGASQFIAVSMIAMGATGIEIIITTLFLNFRHFLMSASIAPKLNIKSTIMKPIISFFVTDESFSVASFAEGQITEMYMVSMQLISYLGWGIGTGVGFILGSIMPPLLQQSMGIGLYALFVALLVPEMKKTNKAIVLALIAGVVNTLFATVLGLKQGWGIVLTIILVSAFGVLIYYNEPSLIIEKDVEELDYE
ncbi:AzlC family ABC transporter permease [Clostridium sp. DL1XJH146]